jgi:hypothetical protein
MRLRSLGLMALVLHALPPLHAQDGKQGPPVELRRPVPESWELKPLNKGEKYWTDRGLYFTHVPKELAGAMMLLRPGDDSKSWLAGDRLIVLRDCRVYAVLRARLQGKNYFPPAIQGKLAQDGWSEVEATIATTVPEGEQWGWRIIKRELKKGEEFPALREMTWGLPVIFVFK